MLQPYLEYRHCGDHSLSKIVLKYYGENYQTELVQRLQTARKLAVANNLEYRSKYKKYFDSKIKPIDIKEGDLCYLHSPEMLKINRKIQSPFLGPYLLLHRVSHHNVVIQHLKTHKTKLVHIGRIRKAGIPSTFSNLGSGLPAQPRSHIAEKITTMPRSLLQLLMEIKIK